MGQISRHLSPLKRVIDELKEKQENALAAIG